MLSFPRASVAPRLRLRSFPIKHMSIDGAEKAEERVDDFSDLGKNSLA